MGSLRPEVYLRVSLLVTAVESLKFILSEMVEFQLNDIKILPVPLE